MSNSAAPYHQIESNQRRYSNSYTQINHNHNHNHNHSHHHQHVHFNNAKLNTVAVPIIVPSDPNLSVPTNSKPIYVHHRPHHHPHIIHRHQPHSIHPNNSKYHHPYCSVQFLCYFLCISIP